MRATGRKILFWILAAWLCCGTLHLLLYSRDFFVGFSMLFCGTVTVLWGVSLRKRVTDQRLMRQLSAISGFLLLYIVLQEVRYSMIGNATAERYLWYICYLPMTALPLLCCATALCVHLPRDQRLPSLYWCLMTTGVILVLGVLTNELHFSFKSYPLDKDLWREHSGWLYYVISAFIYGVYLFSFGLMLYKSRRISRRGIHWLPAVPLAIGLIYYLVYPLEIGVRLFGKRIWNIGEIHCFCLIGALETCIQVGLIPANTDYNRLFTLAGLSAVITDINGQPRYSSGVKVYPFPEHEAIQIHHQPITGGQLSWTADLTDLQKLNQKLEETAQKLAARNAYLAEEARIRAEKTELETRNAIYDRITRIVRPQLDRINALLEREDITFDEKMRPITVMCAYIKRRSNMELLTDTGALPLEELALAVAETADTLRMCGKDTASTSKMCGTLSARLVTAAYEQIEQVIEESFDTLTSLMIFLGTEGQQLTVRMLLTAETLTLPVHISDNSAHGVARSLTVTKNGQDLLLHFCFAAAGGENT